jgi:hypothetical protein
MPSSRYQFRAVSPSLNTELAQRTRDGEEQATAIPRDLGRYYEIMRRDLPVVSEAEASLLVDALNGARHVEPSTIALLWAEIADACEDGLAEKWGVDGAAFVARLRELDYAQCVAVVDAVERYWRGPYHVDDVAARLREVGLIHS